MKKFIWLILILISLNPLAICQILNQDADGNSSIVVPGGTLNFDIQEGLVKASYYKNKNSLASRGTTLGMDLQGKSNEGMSSIFEGGNFSSHAQGSFLIGRYKSYQNREKKRTSRILGYARIGFQVSEFKYDKGEGFTAINSRFRDTLHVTPSIDLGGTWRIGGRWYLGLLIGNKFQNNLNRLRKNNYSYTIEDPSLPGLQQSRDITAYSGNYGTYFNTNIDFDAIYFIPIEGKNYVSPSFYFRYNFTDNKVLAENNAISGISVNFINIESGRFLGGIYLQTNDLFNSKSDYFEKNIQFGLITRISFSSITL